MNTHTFSQMKCNLFPNFGLKTLFGNLPRRTKRLIYLASLLAMIEDINNPSELVVKKLDELFGLANYGCKALKFPMIVHNFIWQKTIYTQPETQCKDSFCALMHEKLEKNDIKELCEYFYRSTPVWLKYGSKNLMLTDIRILLKHIPELTV